MKAERAEELLRQMRDRAIMIEANQELRDLKKDELEQVRQRSLKKLEEMKKLYFNAGRWSGGARDWSARKAFEVVFGDKNAAR